MKVFYPVVFTATNDAKDTYLISIPDLEGMTEGHGLEDAINMARDYVGCALYNKVDDEFPISSKITDINLEKTVFYNKGETFCSIVDLDIDSYRRKMEQKSIRRNVSIPLWLDKAAKKANINVSRVLQEALIEKLDIHQ